MSGQGRNKGWEKWLPCMLILLQSALYGFGDPITKTAYEVVPVFSLLSVRYFIAFIVLLFLCGRKTLEELRAIPVKRWIAPCLCIALSYIVGNVALFLTAATSVAFLRSLSTVFTPLLAWLIFHKRYGWGHICLQLLVIVGLYLLCGAGGLGTFGSGEIAALLAACFTAGSLVFGARSLESISPTVLTTLQAGTSTLLATLAAFFFDGGLQVGQASPKVWAIILYLALACTLAGYLLQNLALEHIPARTVALLQCACPVLTAAFSFFLLDETLSRAGHLGSGIILLCIAAESFLEE